MTKANTTTVAQAISFAIDEAQEGLVGEEGGLFLGDGPLRITEVGAQLLNFEGDESSRGYPYSQFTVTTSDGQTFEVRIRAIA